MLRIDAVESEAEREQHDKGTQRRATDKQSMWQISNDIGYRVNEGVGQARRIIVVLYHIPDSADVLTNNNC